MLVGGQRQFIVLQGFVRGDIVGKLNEFNIDSFFGKVRLDGLPEVLIEGSGEAYFYRYRIFRAVIVQIPGGRGSVGGGTAAGAETEDESRGQYENDNFLS